MFLVELKWCRFLASAWNSARASSCWYCSASSACARPNSPSSSLNCSLRCPSSLSSCLRMQKLCMTLRMQQPRNTFWMSVACCAKQVRCWALVCWASRCRQSLRAQCARNCVSTRTAAAFLRRNSLRLMYILNLDWILRAAALSLAHCFSHSLARRQYSSLTVSARRACSAISSINYSDIVILVLCVISSVVEQDVLQFGKVLLLEVLLVLAETVLALLGGARTQDADVEGVHVGLQAVVHALLQLGKVPLASEFVECGQAGLLYLEQTLVDDFLLFVVDVNGAQFSGLHVVAAHVLFVVEQELEVVVERVGGGVRMDLHHHKLIIIKYSPPADNLRTAHTRMSVKPWYNYTFMNHQQFIREWALFRKTGKITALAALLQTTPSNPHELAFLLQVATAHHLLATLPPALLPSLAIKHTTSNLNDNTAKELITPQYVRKLLGVYGEMRNQSWSGSKEGRAREILAQVLAHSTATIKPTERQQPNAQDIQVLKLLGSCYNLLRQHSKAEDALRTIKNWWTCRQYIAGQVSEGTLELLLLWGHQEASNDMQWLQDTNTLTEKIFTLWLTQTQIQLISNKPISQQVISSVESQTKEICKICKFKTNKNSKEMFKSIKETFLKNFSKVKQPQIFSTVFSVLQITAQQSQFTPFTFLDLLQYEQLFYSTLLQLQKYDKLFLFVSFHSFMRQQSIMSVLQINYTLTLSLQKHKQQETRQNINQMVRQKKMQVMQRFKEEPITTSTTVIDYFLKDSGILIKQHKKKVRVGLNYIKMNIIDPLLLLLIKKESWQDKFGFEVLGLAAWIICQAYCKELLFRLKPSEKTVTQYIKKLKIALCLHLLGLKYPTKMLMYLPEQPEIAWDFATVPILPALLVQTQYFFKEFLRDQLEIRPRTDLSIQGEVMPWSNRIMAQSSIPFILHNYKGYRFFTEILPFIGSNSLVPFAETIINSVKLMLQSLGGNGAAQDPDRRQLNSQLNQDTKSDLRTLLTRLMELCPKTASNAQQMVAWLT